ncbi:MAG TPA: DUF4232 domain-containing protein [Chloroflexota bacterium]|nr:DUF4232 domain-containing protein [Chloroflexota bacterium]
MRKQSSWQGAIFRCTVAIVVVLFAVTGFAASPSGVEAAAACTAGSLIANAPVQGATQALVGSVIFTNVSTSGCTLQGVPTIQILDATGAVLAVSQTNLPPGPGGTTGPITLRSLQLASVFIHWDNFCQSPMPPSPFSLKVTLPGDGSLTVLLISPGTIPPTPPCASPSSPSILSVGPFQPYTIAPAIHDERYFPQTGFRIDNDTIWDYFNRRGGVPTFGFPVSRTFLFQGFQVQFFQRRIVQLAPNGQARLLNVLDPGLMPFNSFNFAAVPPYDAGLVATAPNPTDAAATLAFVQAHAPDTFQGLPVNFYQTFINTVPFIVAFPSGGNSALVPGFDLEMWGIPTSAPTFDPNNHNFVYLRFQRGIMHFDATCTCTQGLLLADYLKSILTGVNLPADLNQEASTSPFYKQYDPGVPNWVRDPSLLPATDLTNAFTPG